MLKWLQIYLVLLIIRESSELCDRRPQGAIGDPSPADDSFRVLIEGNPATYIPNQRYNISLSCDATLKFIDFTLVADSEDNSTQLTPETIGYFEIIDTAETRFSSQCQNMIESTNGNIKIRISVGWVAPSAAGCVLIRAAVLQHRNVWFIDDGFLTKRFCPEEIDEVNSQSPPVDPCCACDEAKYELIVERKWGPNTHPHDFPAEKWRTRLGELVGASHTQDYRFWMYGALASPGLQELAEHGSTKLLEREIKSGNIRTIIKAPGIPYRKNVISSTLANVRVDPQHHVISLVTKIQPSPDWILGVAGLEMCLQNCTWINEKVLNLYPWDIGTDAGPSYMSPDQRQKPADVVRRITSTSPNDQRSPFYEETGEPMKPMAILSVKRKKIYARECESAESIPLECATHPWNTWSECTARCGPGTQERLRTYKDPTLAASFNCQVVLRQTQRCVGEKCGLTETELENVDDNTGTCELTPWSSWTPCSRRCGRGVKTRTREFVNPYEGEKCLNDNQIELEQRRACEGRDCGGKEALNRDEAEDDQVISGSTGTEGYDMDREIIDPREDEGLNRLPQPELFGQRRSNLNSRRPLGRRPFTTNERNFGSSAFDKTESEPNDLIDDVTGQEDSENGDKPNGITYNRPYGNRVSYKRPPFRGLGGNDNMGVREEYDENGHKAIYIESSDPSKYNVVQDYCFQKPYLRKSRCGRKIVGIRNYWFYDSDDYKCKLFTTDDCDDNKNKFRSLETCENTCLLPLTNKEEEEETVNREFNEHNEWSQQFGQPESLVRKTQRRKQQQKRRKWQQQRQRQHQQQEIAGNILYR